MISFVCCYNNYDAMIVMRSSLVKLQDYELIVVDNTSNRFMSASSALNHGFNMSCGDIMIFLHQDIIVPSADDIREIAGFLNANPNSIVGVAGIKNRIGAHVISSMYDPTHPAGYRTLSGPQEVFTVDECFVALSRDTFKAIGQFDEVNFDGWHMYVADLCMTGKRYKVDTYVLPTSIIHMSKGKADVTWWKYMEIARQKHSSNFGMIRTTCGWMFTNNILNMILSFYRSCRR